MSNTSAGPVGVAGKPMDGWEEAPTKLTRRCVFAEIYGDTGTGRTSLALSAPGPIALIHCAEKLEGVVQKYAGEKKIMQHNFGAVFTGKNDDEIARQADVVWQEMKKRWMDAFRWARTIVLDTHTDAWELIRLARFGALKPEKGRVDANYGPVNAEWLGLFKAFKAQDRANVIVLGKTKDEYKEDKKGMGQRTGRTIVAGQKDIQYLSDVRIRTDRDILGGTFQATIIKGWWNAQMEGVTVENDMSNFPQIMELITERDGWDK